MAHREVQLLKTLKHQHVIRYYNSFHDEKSLYIVMEYCERGDLYKVDYYKNHFYSFHNRR